ncbi:protein S100-B-like [Nerophis ophidion]|uniref:protein S100-B-like n=1 Tax=Nerophis ophidion TaxID=159077 RepID=UPI002ADFE855|nr:protein S100-B-like [Nerophis ophidion]
MEASKDRLANLENAMVTTIREFHRYSGDKCKLKKADLRALVNNEMRHFIKSIQKREMDELFADIDQNGDMEIDFKEFIAFIAMVTSACHELFLPAHGAGCRLQKRPIGSQPKYEPPTE